MSDRELLDIVYGTPWIADLLAYFDFDVTRRDEEPVEPVSLPGNESLELIAGDAAGGAFFLVGAGAVRPVLYVGSEGDARARLQRALDLTPGPDLLESLHAAAADDRYRPINGVGNRYRSMVGSTDEDEPPDRRTAVIPALAANPEAENPVRGQLPLF